MSDRPSDACPYHRPFADDFSACPAYRPTRLLVLDMQYRPLASVNACGHLAARSLPGPGVGFYPQCLVGDARAREEWAERFAAERLRRIRLLARQLAESTRRVSEQMWEAKADQLRRARAGSDEEPARRRLRRAAEAYEEAARRFLERDSGRLEELGISPEAILGLVREALFDWALRTDAIESYRPSPEVLERFPADVRAFLTPNVS